MKKQKEMVKIGHLDVPVDYFTLPVDEKEVICNSILESMLYLLEKHIDPEVNRFEILNKIIDSSIIMNEDHENYEVAGVLFDIRKMINE
jgi:hypothetical protein